MTSQKPTTCRYCHAALPHRMSLGLHYGTCTVLATCLEPASPFRVQPRSREGARASRADQQRGIARARLKAEKDKG